MTDFRKEDFFYVEDEVMTQECVECGHVYEESDYGEELADCPNCGSRELMNTTYHEGRECAICNKYFDTWTDGFTKKDDESIIICEDCMMDL